MDSGGSRGEGAATLLLILRHAYASGADYQALADEEVQQERADVVAEEGRRNCEPMRIGILQPHGRRQGGMN